MVVLLDKDTGVKSSGPFEGTPADNSWCAQLLQGVRGWDVEARVVEAKHRLDPSLESNHQAAKEQGQRNQTLNKSLTETSSMVVSVSAEALRLSL